MIGHGKDNGKDKDGNKNWQEALATTLEEEPRRHRPNDGLVALLYPSNATRMALDRPDDATVVATAERECARLVWDDDSGSHYLVHPALATPFCVTIERAPAWSRTEYTLEHHESPRHLAKLTRDGTGQGWLEVDSGLASKIESFFIIDVAVVALLLVAAGDERHARVETFEPPPLIGGGGSGEPRRFSSRMSSSRNSRRDENSNSKRANSGKKRSGGSSKMEEFELDLESQNGSFAKLEEKVKEQRDKLPWPLRLVVRLLTALFKFVIWCLTMGFRALGLVLRGCLRCCGEK
jgi:hypothetical protein